MATIGTALAPLALSMTSLVAAVGPLITLMGATGIAGALGTAGAALTAILPPLAAVGAAIATAIVIWKNWDAIVAGSRAVWNGFETMMADAATTITTYAQTNMQDGIRTWIVDRLAGLTSSVQSSVNALVSPFRWMYDTVVGHSIVPDMVTGIGARWRASIRSWCNRRRRRRRRR